MADSLRPHELYSPRNSPGQNTGEGSLSLLQGIFSTQGLNPGLLHCRRILYQLKHKGSPDNTIAQNNSYTKACLAVACPELLQSLGMAFSAALQVHPVSTDSRPAGTRGSSHVWVGCTPQKQRAPVLHEQGMGVGNDCEVFSITPRHSSCYRGEELCRELEFPKCRVGLRESHLQVTVIDRGVTCTQEENRHLHLCL